MKFPNSTCLFATLCIALVPLASGQIKSSPPVQGEHPVYTLVFKPGGAIPGLRIMAFRSHQPIGRGPSTNWT